MKKPLFLMVIAAMFLWSCNNGGGGTANVKLESELDSVSYGLGVIMQTNLSKQFEDLNLAAVAKGMSDGKANPETVLIKAEDANAIIEAYVQRGEAAKNAPKIEANKAFLRQNKEKEGVVTTQSGLQYEIMTEGTGASPTATDKVVCHYHGTLLDGTVFDSSVDRGEPATFPVGGVIRGWTEALQLMKVGSKWKLYVPSDLAYGERGGQGMAPHSLLIFEVELISIVKG